jgi:hypothetical protein
MATIGGDWPTLLDVSKRLDPDGRIGPIVESLQQQNEILLDAPFIEGNLPTGHQVTVRTGLPAVYYRRINQGVPPSKSTTAQVTETVANLEAFSRIDQRLAELNGLQSQWAISEELSFVESMNQQVAESTFYASEASVPEEFTGFSIRYSDMSAASAENIIDAGGTGSDNGSIWFITWGPQSTYFIYPKGGKQPLDMEDMGLQLVEDDNGNPFRAYMSHWRWTPGLCVADWQGNVRIANIDMSNLIDESSAPDLMKLLIKAAYKIPKRVMGRTVIYVNGTVAAMLDIQSRETPNLMLQYSEVGGVPQTSFRGIPIRRVDQLLETEARVV